MTTSRARPIPQLSPLDEARVSVADAAAVVADLARGLVPVRPDWRTDDPASYLRDALTIQDRFVSWLITRAVVVSRESGATWEQLGEVAGMSRQSAHERWSALMQGWNDGGRRMQAPGGPSDALRVAHRLDAWYAVGRTGGDPIVTGPRGVRAVSDGLEVTKALPKEWEDDRPARPKTTEAMRRSLHFYTDHDFGDGALRYLLAYPPPDLLADALEWGWEDPRVRRRLAEALTNVLLTGKTWPDDDSEAALEPFLKQLIAADRRFPAS